MCLFSVRASASLTPVFLNTFHSNNGDGTDAIGTTLPAPSRVLRELVEALGALVEDGLPLVRRPELHRVELQLGVLAHRALLLDLPARGAGRPTGGGQRRRGARSIRVARRARRRGIARDAPSASSCRRRGPPPGAPAAPRCTSGASPACDARNASARRCMHADTRDARAAARGRTVGVLLVTFSTHTSSAGRRRTVGPVTRAISQSRAAAAAAAAAARRRGGRRPS